METKEIIALAIFCSGFFFLMGFLYAKVKFQGQMVTITNELPDRNFLVNKVDLKKGFGILEDPGEIKKEKRFILVDYNVFGESVSNRDRVRKATILEEKAMGIAHKGFPTLIKVTEPIETPETEKGGQE